MDAKIQFLLPSGSPSLPISKINMVHVWHKTVYPRGVILELRSTTRDRRIQSTATLQDTVRCPNDGEILLCEQWKGVSQLCV